MLSLGFQVAGSAIERKTHTDTYKGIIVAGGRQIITSLTLHHEPYSDDGTFSLSETIKGATNKATGDWTVLRGDAQNPNATVVELDGAGRTLYFLRRKDGRLQQLDTGLRTILPVKNNLLEKQSLHKKR